MRSSGGRTSIGYTYPSPFGLSSWRESPVGHSLRVVEMQSAGGGRPTDAMLLRAFGERCISNPFVLEPA